MALVVTHTKIVVTPDDGTSEVGTDEWNDTHTLTGTVSVAQGGTGVTSLGALTKTDDTNVTLTLGGSPNTALVNAASLTLGWTGSLAATRGGTGQSTFAKGDILASPGSNTLNKLTVGSDGLVLTADVASTNGVKWAAASAVILPLHLTDANTVEQYNTTTAQTLKVYNTFTDTSNYERGIFDWVATANSLTIGTQAQGTGTARNIIISPAGTEVLIGNNAHLKLGSGGGSYIFLQSAAGNGDGLYFNGNNFYGIIAANALGVTDSWSLCKNASLGGVTPVAALSWHFPASGAGNVVIGTAAIATNATDGFLYIPTCAGTPTGTPTTFTGRVAMVYDTTNNKFYIYNGAWKGGTNPGAFT